MTLRYPFVALALAAGLSLPAAAQGILEGAADDARQRQLDRIEEKLDAILRHLDPGAQVPSSRAPSPASDDIDTGAAADEVSPIFATPPATESIDSYAPGALAIAHAAPSDARQLGDIPADSIGGFVYTGGPIQLSDLADRGVRYAGPAGIELQGWLRVTESGRYQIAADLQVRFGENAITPLPCAFTAWIEDQSVGTETQVSNPWDHREKPAAISLVLGAEVQPGLYKTRLWIACAEPQGPARLQRLQAELLLKAPSELNLRPITGEDFLHQAG